MSSRFFAAAAAVGLLLDVDVGVPLLPQAVADAATSAIIAIPLRMVVVRGIHSS
jgi:hypothetical protein